MIDAVPDSNIMRILGNLKGIEPHMGSFLFQEIMNTIGV